MVDVLFHTQCGGCLVCRMSGVVVACVADVVQSEESIIMMMMKKKMMMTLMMIMKMMMMMKCQQKSSLNFFIFAPLNMLCVNF